MIIVDTRGPMAERQLVVRMALIMAVSHHLTIADDHALNRPSIIWHAQLAQEGVHCHPSVQCPSN